MSLQNSAGVKVPADLVLVGYVSGAYGLQGWIKVTPFSSVADALLSAKVWWVDKPDLRDVDVMQVKLHSGDVVAQIMGVAGREGAEALKGASVHVPRSHFPALADGEFYWVDLIGLTVENLQGEPLGVVHDMMENGAHPILRVSSVATPGQVQAPEILIPFVDQFIKTVDQQNNTVIVDWGLDY